MADSDELVSQFLMFTGSEDTAKAISYLEMSAGDLERAVSLFMDHTQGGGGGGGTGGASAGLMDEVRAPDATQTMRLMDDVGPMMGAMPYMPFDHVMQERLQHSAFASPILNVREAINAAAAADSDEDVKESTDDDDSNAEEKKHMARLADMFAPPDHLIYKEGGFEGARTMAKDSKRWLLVNLQKDSEFACHALNRDVWRDELVENLIREGFIFWQSVRSLPICHAMRCFPHEHTTWTHISFFSSSSLTLPPKVKCMHRDTMCMITLMWVLLTPELAVSCGRKKGGHSRIP